MKGWGGEAPGRRANSPLSPRCVEMLPECLNAVPGGRGVEGHNSPGRFSRAALPGFRATQHSRPTAEGPGLPTWALEQLVPGR